MHDLLLIGGATPEVLERTSAAFRVHQWQDISDHNAWLTENGESISYVMTNGHDGISSDLMKKLPNLRLISCNGVGYDNINVEAANQLGVVVTHTPDVLSAEVATVAVLLMLACYRELLRDDAFVRSGEWEAGGNTPLTRSADGQAIGILGMGRIGQVIAEKFAPWSPTILYHSRNPKDVPYQYFRSLVDMAQQSDVLICITPGGDSTRHLVNADVLKALGPQGTLINVGRGSAVDEGALIAALQSRQLGWAGLDVFEDEPRVPKELRAMDNVILLPHVGSATVETRAAMGDLVVNNLLQHLKDGTALTPVPECSI